jgi:hypothetical protein
LTVINKKGEVRIHRYHILVLNIRSILWVFFFPTSLERLLDCDARG